MINVVTYLLVILLNNDPKALPVIQLVSEFENKALCTKFVEEVRAPPQIKARMACLGVVQEVDEDATFDSRPENNHTKPIKKEPA